MHSWQMICWCFVETKPATTYLSELILSKAGIVEVTTVPVVWRPDSELWKASHPLDSSPLRPPVSIMQP